MFFNELQQKLERKKEDCSQHKISYLCEILCSKITPIAVLAY